MDFIKKFFSHTLAILLFTSALLLTGIFASRELINHNNIYRALEKSEILDEALKTNTNLKDLNIPEQLLEYIEIEDIVYNYITDKFLYEAKVIKKEPEIDEKELNKRLALAIEAYIDDKIDEYTGGFNSILESSGIDLGIDEKVEDYINNNTSIDLSKEEIITKKDLESIYAYSDEAFSKIKESSYVFEIIELIYNDKVITISIIAIIASIILIALINFDIAISFLYSIAPFVLNAIIYLIVFIVTIMVNFDGNLSAKVINSIKGTVGQIAFKYFFVFILLTLTSALLFYVFKNINILIARKSGKTTLDTVFDDYDSDEVVKVLQSDEEKDETKEEKN